MAVDRQDFLWMVVDNGSTDDSIEQIQAFLENRQIPFVFYKEGDDLTSALQARRGVVYALKENYGFAKGNNLGIELVERSVKAFGPESFFPEYYLLLNNDTEVEPDFLSKLEDFARNHPEYVALTPQIRYGNEPEKIWNCGGRMFWGFRKYYYGEQDEKSLERKGWIPVNLVTGCALFAKRELVGDPDFWMESSAGRSENLPPRLLTERFFFGEEDFDFSLRMQEEKKKMACVLDSVVYHKQGGAQNRLNATGRIYVHYLNRFVDVRQHWGRGPKFMLWRWVYMPYMCKIFKQAGLPLAASWQKVRRLVKESLRTEEVTAARFKEILARE